MPRALGGEGHVGFGSEGRFRRRRRAYMRADLTSSMGRTPFLSPSMGSAKRLYASLISPSFCAETLCSFASFDRGAALGAPVAGAVLRFGGCA